MRFTQTLALALALFSSCSNASHDVRDAPAFVASPGLAQPLPARPLYAVPVGGLPVIGEGDALVTIVEFTDYDCPYCAKAEHTLKALRQRYGRDLRVAVAEHPLPMHPHARDAALAALAANELSLFAPVHSQLFENPDSRSAPLLSSLARESGIDPGAFERTRSSEGPKTALERAQALATSLHVTGTPTFFINGRKLAGAQPLEVFDAIVVDELDRARALVAGGVARDQVYDAIQNQAHARPVSFDDDPAEEEVSVPEAKTVGGAHLVGSSNAAHTILLFTDFECPYCKKLDAKLRELAAQRTDVRVVLRNSPLRMHEHARLAAKAAIAADVQGQLEAFAKLMFGHQDALDRASLESYATRVGLDAGKFARDLDSPDTDARLAEDESFATKLGVRGTPTSFVEGRRIVGAQPIASFEAALYQNVAR